MSAIRRHSALAAVGLLALACSGAPNYEGRTPAPPDHPRWPPPQPTAAWEPPQTPYPDVTFEDAGVNPFRDPIRDPYSTFAMDSPYSRGHTLDDVAVEADRLARAFDGRSDLAEFSQLASRAARIGLR